MKHHTDSDVDAALEGEFCRLIVQNSDDYAIFTIDRSRRILTWNRGAETILGYAAADAIGRSTDCIFTDEDLASGVPQQEVDTALKTGRADDNRWHVRRDGSRFWASGVMMRLGDDPENPLALAKILRDQTALKLAQEERDQAAEALRGKVELRKEQVELSGVVDRAVEMAMPVIREGSHRFSQRLPEEPILLDADPVRLSQVLANILNNAAKYTESGGRIDLEARLEAGEVCIDVSDSGVGIDPELLPRVFDLFTQAAQGIDRPKGGLEIGLTVVQNLVEMHGGSVAVASDGPGRGCRFSVRLPILRVGRSRTLCETAAEPTPDYRILIVDDNLAAAKMLSLLLSKLGGHTVFTAHDGAEAVEAAGRHRPDVILLDIGLPKLNGYEVAGRLRNSSDTAGVLITALTGYGGVDDRRRSLEAGFDEHLVKPPSLAALRKLLIHPKLAAAKQGDTVPPTANGNGAG